MWSAFNSTKYCNSSQITKMWTRWAHSRNINVTSSCPLRIRVIKAQHNNCNMVYTNLSSLASLIPGSLWSISPSFLALLFLCLLTVCPFLYHLFCCSSKVQPDLSQCCSPRSEWMGYVCMCVCLYTLCVCVCTCAWHFCMMGVYKYCNVFPKVHLWNLPKGFSLAIVK